MFLNLLNRDLKIKSKKQVRVNQFQITLPQRQVVEDTFLSLFAWRSQSSGMDELANWTAKTYKFSFHNDSGQAARAPVKGESRQRWVWSEEWNGNRNGDMTYSRSGFW